MAAKTTVKVAVTNNAAKDDNILDLGETANDTWTLNVLDNDPGSAKLWSVGEPTTSSSTGMVAKTLTTSVDFKLATGPGGALENYTAKISIVGNALSFQVFDANGNLFDSDRLADGQQIAFSTKYTAQMANGTLSTANVNVVVTGTNDGPIANADVGSVDENATVVINALANDTDVDTGAVLSLVSATSAKGDVSIVNGKIEFTANAEDFDHLAAGVKEDVTITYVMQDEHGAQSTSTVTVTVTGVNDAPVAVADTAAVNEGDSVTIDALANDLDADDGHVLSLVSVSSDKGSVSIADGKIVFNADDADFDHLPAGATEDVTVTYVMKDDQGAESTSTVTVTVTGVNDAPTAVADTAAVNEGDSVTIDALANDLDVDDGHVLSLVSVSSDKGSVSIADGKIVFNADDADFDHLPAGATEDVTVTYVMKDDQGAESTSTVTVTVTGVNDAPTAEAATATVLEDSNTSGQLVADDLDDGAVLTFSTTDTPTGFVLNADGSWTFDASSYDSLKAGQELPITVNYTVTDEHDASANSTLTITVTGVNDDPTLTSGAQTGSVTEDGTLKANGQVSANDVDGDTLTYSAASTAGTYGSISVNSSTGAWEYTLANTQANVQALNTGDTRTDTFTVNVSDGNGGTTSQNVVVTINGANEPVTVVTRANVVTDDSTNSDSKNFNTDNAGGNNNGGTINGTIGPDVLVGGPQGQSINGGEGNDIIYGRGGSDNIFGGPGNDIVYGQDGGDNIHGGAGDDIIYGGSGSDTITGDPGNDKIYGGSGGEFILGGDGNDIIFGGVGADTLSGGEGNDIFVYLTLDDIGDTITDFNNPGDDTIDVTAIDANATLAGNQEFTGYYGSTATAFGLWSEVIGGNTVLYGDTDGNASTAEFWVTLTGTPTLTGADFVL